MSQTDNDVPVGQFRVAPELLQRGYRDGSGPCHCTASCCEGGVYLDVQERDRILAHRDLVRKYMDDSQPAEESLWFEYKEDTDPDFPSGRCDGTREVSGKCAFLDRSGRCSLQVAATSEGMHRWALKPFFCVLYPIEVSENRVSFDSLLQGEEACCSVTERFELPLFRACKDELTFLLGEDGYGKLEEAYQISRRPKLPAVAREAIHP